MGHTFNSSAQDVNLYESEASLVYIMSFEITRAIQWDITLGVGVWGPKPNQAKPTKQKDKENYEDILVFIY